MKGLVHGRRDLISKDLLVHTGSTKCEADNEKTLEGILRNCHADRETDRTVLIEWDEESYSYMVNAMKSNFRRYYGATFYRTLMGGVSCSYPSPALLELYCGGRNR